MRQRLFVDVLHHDELHSIAVIEPMARYDVGVIERSHELGFPLKASYGVPIQRHRLCGFLGRDFPIKLCVLWLRRLRLRGSDPGAF